MTKSDDQKRGRIKFTKRKGIFLVIMAPVLFLLSGLFLANTVFYPAESFPFQVGRLLCFVVTPILLISGIFMYATARRAEKKAKPTAAPQVPMPSRIEIRKYAKITAIAGVGSLTKGKNLNMY